MVSVDGVAGAWCYVGWCFVVAAFAAVVDVSGRSALFQRRAIAARRMAGLGRFVREEPVRPFHDGGSQTFLLQRAQEPAAGTYVPVQLCFL
jgi:hypothetical protein